MPPKTAADLSRLAGLKPPAIDLLPLAQNSRHFVDLLIERNLWRDAINFLSHAITQREAIWWAWFCARRAALPKSEPDELKALSLAEAWIAQPTEENRQAAHHLQIRMPSGGPQSLLEAIYSTGEIQNEASGEKAAAIPYLSCKFVNVTVLSAIYTINAEQPETIAAEFLKQALDVANRIQLWTHYS